MISFAGIGARATPESILKEMGLIGQWAKSQGYFINSGHADGADYAFEKGALEQTKVFLPWKNFNKEVELLGKPFVVGDNEVLDEWVEKFHPAPQNLSFGARKLMRRNVCQVLNEGLDDPVQAVICWTQSGGLTGGTAFAMRIAAYYHIPIFNMFDSNFATAAQVIAELTKLV